MANNRFAKQGLGSVRRDWNVLRAVRRFRNQGQGPSWEYYLSNTRNGKVKYTGVR